MRSISSRTSRSATVRDDVGDRFPDDAVRQPLEHAGAARPSLGESRAGADAERRGQRPVAPADARTTALLGGRAARTNALGERRNAADAVAAGSRRSIPSGSMAASSGAVRPVRQLAGGIETGRRTACASGAGDSARDGRLVEAVEVRRRPSAVCGSRRRTGRRRATARWRAIGGTGLEIRALLELIEVVAASTGPAVADAGHRRRGRARLRRWLGTRLAGRRRRSALASSSLTRAMTSCGSNGFASTPSQPTAAARAWSTGSNAPGQQQRPECAPGAACS